MTFDHLACTRPILSYAYDHDRRGLSVRIPIVAAPSPYPEHVHNAFEVGVYVTENTYRVEVGGVRISGSFALFAPSEKITSIEDFREPVGMALRIARKRVDDVVGCKNCASDLRLKIEAAYAVVLDRDGVAWMPECERG
jgi:hypothetical protein